MASLSDPLVRELLDGRSVACLGTENSDGSVHLVAVWYLFDGGALYVATASRSRKARNVEARPRASLMVDSRDPQASRGVTVSGAAELLKGEASREWNARIHRRYLSEAALADPRVGPVFAGWDDVTIRLKPKSVVAWDMREADRAVMGGAFAENPAYLRKLDL
ncbi:MAG TPA: TIGR03618 family F420-dependent PPOX class oxidoreductase [Terriglobales bacterium]|nr:TIGR03618 family F420-dependent PPOX class oxidoreductase [Terriglobales bacterium]